MEEWCQTGAGRRVKGDSDVPYCKDANGYRGGDLQENG